MEWTALRDLVAVAETGSLSGAARTLGVSQPTIGRRIEALETELNVLFFNRTTRGLTPTETGEQVLAYARRMADEALSIERIASGANTRLEGSVRITLPDMLGSQWLPEKLPEFYRRYPGLRLEVMVDNRSLNLVKREADIAIRFARPRQLDLVVRRAVDFHYGLYGSRAYLARHGRPRSVRDLKDHVFISYDQTMFHIHHLERFEKLVGEKQIINRSTSIASILSTVKQGVGLGITACYCSDPEPELERLLAERLDFSFTAWVVTHADIHRSIRIREVFNFLHAKLEEDRAQFTGRG